MSICSSYKSEKTIKKYIMSVKTNFINQKMFDKAFNKKELRMDMLRLGALLLNAKLEYLSDKYSKVAMCTKKDYLLQLNQVRLRLIELGEEDFDVNNINEKFNYVWIITLDYQHMDLQTILQKYLTVKGEKDYNTGIVREDGSDIEYTSDYSSDESNDSNDSESDDSESEDSD